MLSNGRYTMMLTAAGSGYSRRQDLAITRWREDATRDNTGSYILLRDVASGKRRSAGFQPSLEPLVSYEVSFAEHVAEFISRDGTIATRFEVIVSSEDHAIGELEWETDRGQLLGRGRTVRDPRAEADAEGLSNRVGSVLDPIVSLRRRVRVRPGQTVRLVFSAMVASSRSAVLDLANTYNDVATFERDAALACTQTERELRHLGIASADILARHTEDRLP